MRKKIAFIAAIFCLFVFNLNSASAYRRCEEPRMPDCVDREDGGFRDERQRERCKNDVRDFTRDVEEFRQCLSWKQDEMQEQAEQALRRFDCRVEDRTYCR